MAIHTGGNQRSGARADAAASDPAASATRINGKDVPQFAPNFSVYAMPPDAVCFYSEDRKFVLHGELFCALAGLIGTGKSFAQIARQLTKTYPADVVDEALKRLIDRRYIVAKRPSSPDTAAAYWATLGLPLDIADKNLKACRVRVQSLDAKGGKELGAALKKLGVRVVDRAADREVVPAGAADVGHHGGVVREAEQPLVGRFPGGAALEADGARAGRNPEEGEDLRPDLGHHAVATRLVAPRARLGQAVGEQLFPAHAATRPGRSGRPRTAPGAGA